MLISKLKSMNSRHCKVFDLISKDFKNKVPFVKKLLNSWVVEFLHESSCPSWVLSVKRNDIVRKDIAEKKNFEIGESSKDNKISK